MTVNQRMGAIRARLSELQAQFPSGDCYVLSVASDTYNMKGGMVMQVPLSNAARHLVEGSHRLATDAEIENYLAQQAEVRLYLRSREAPKGVTFVQEVPSGPRD